MSLNISRTRSPSSTSSPTNNKKPLQRKHIEIELENDGKQQETPKTQMPLSTPPTIPFNQSTKPHKPDVKQSAVAEKLIFLASMPQPLTTLSSSSTVTVSSPSSSINSNKIPESTILSLKTLKDSCNILTKNSYTSYIKPYKWTIGAMNVLLIALSLVYPPLALSYLVTLIVLDGLAIPTFPRLRNKEVTDNWQKIQSFHDDYFRIIYDKFSFANGHILQAHMEKIKHDCEYYLQSLPGENDSLLRTEEKYKNFEDSIKLHIQLSLENIIYRAEKINEYEDIKTATDKAHFRNNIIEGIKEELEMWKGGSFFGYKVIKHNEIIYSIHSKLQLLHDMHRLNKYETSILENTELLNLFTNSQKEVFNSIDPENPIFYINQNSEHLTR